MLHPYPGDCGHRRTELTTVPGRGMNVVQNLQKFRIGTYECPTELTEVLCREIPGVNTPGTVCTYPTEHNLAILHVQQGDFSDGVDGVDRSHPLLPAYPHHMYRTFERLESMQQA